MNPIFKSFIKEAGIDLEEVIDREIIKMFEGKDGWKLMEELFGEVRENKNE